MKKLRQITQAEIARQMGTQQPSVNRWLKGQRMPKLANLMKLSSILGQTPEETIVQIIQAKIKNENQKLA